MAKSIKLKDNTYLDSSGIVHKNNTNEIGILKDILGNWGNTQSITDYSGDLNDMLRTGWVMTGTLATNVPPATSGDTSYYVLTFVKNPDYYVKQIAFARNGNAIYQRRKTAPSTWTPWSKTPYTDTVATYTLGLSNNWSENGRNYAFVDAQGIKHLQVSVRYGTSTTVGTLPQELRPAATFLTPATNLNNSGYVTIADTGVMTVSSNIFTSGSSNLAFSATYL